MTPSDFLYTAMAAAASPEEIADLLRVLAERDPILFDAEFRQYAATAPFGCFSFKNECRCANNAHEIEDDFEVPDVAPQSFLSAEAPAPAENHGIDRLLETLSREELIEAMKRVMARSGGEDVLRFDTITGRSVVVELRGRGNRFFKDDFVYGFYLRDAAGETLLPLRFTHRWSYGIYIMWLIDRVKCRETAGPLSLRRNRDAFCWIYRRLFGLPQADAEEAFERLVSREVVTSSGVKCRSGRFNDCVRDIDRVISSIAGTYEGIPLKVRPSAPLGVNPDQISLPPELLEVKIIH